MVRYLAAWTHDKKHVLGVILCDRISSITDLMASFHRSLAAWATEEPQRSV